MEMLIKNIQENGWNKATKQLVRQAVVNQPTGRWSYYDLHKCFYEEVSIEHVCAVLRGLTMYEKHEPRIRSKHLEQPERLNRLYGNVLHSNECHREFTDEDELIEFWCGTSMTRAKEFVSNGGGYTQLEHPVYLDNGLFVQYGIQVMLEDFRAADYAYRQAYVLADKPAIIHGYIAAKYLFGANNPNEYGIPCEYYAHMKNTEIITY
jgi:hypothetical protein